jgi:hypothetical protein
MVDLKQLSDFTRYGKIFEKYSGDKPVVDIICPS